MALTLKRLRRHGEHHAHDREADAVEERGDRVDRRAPEERPLGPEGRTERAPEERPVGPEEDEWSIGPDEDVERRAPDQPTPSTPQDRAALLGRPRPP